MNFLKAITVSFVLFYNFDLSCSHPHSNPSAAKRILLNHLQPDIRASIPRYQIRQIGREPGAFGHIFNDMSMEELLEVPWRQLLPLLSADDFNYMDRDVLSIIPWRGTVGSFHPNIIRGLDVYVFESMPAEASEYLSVEALEAIPTDVLYQLPMGFLERVPWQTLAQTSGQFQGRYNYAMSRSLQRFLAESGK